jgi:hypothetical protein
LKHCATRWEVPGSIPVVSYSFCPHSVALEPLQPLTDQSTQEFPWECSAVGASCLHLCLPSCAKCQNILEMQTFQSPPAPRLWVFMASEGKLSLTYLWYIIPYRTNVENRVSS